MRAVDTNILVRYTLGDDPVQSPKALALIEAGDLFVPRTVILEYAWVLENVYGFAPDKVAGAVDFLLTLPGLGIEDAHQVRNALHAVQGGVEFEDALHWAASSQCEVFLTFDDRRFVRRAARLGLKPPCATPD